MDYGFYLSKLAKRRIPSILRDLYDAIGVDPNYILMAGGLPNPDTFAIKTATLQLSDGSEVSIDEDEMKQAMQYGTTYGHKEVVKFVEDLTKRIHDPPTLNNPDHPGELKIVMTSGAQDAIYKTLECLVDEGDIVLTAEPVYVSFLAAVIPMGAIIERIEMDKDGIIPESLVSVLSKYQKQTGNQQNVTRKIKLLYCIPNGDNPTGVRYTTERKQEIYRLAQEYNFLIMEDDAYYFLEERPFTPSLLSMDVDGRVLRLDTFSKTVGPGFRIGSVMGPKHIVQRILSISQVSSQGCSSMSQAVLLTLLRKWGIDGYLENCDRVNEFYGERRKICLDLAEKYFTGLGEWTRPTGGMFIWIRFYGIPDSHKFIMERVAKRKVLIVMGAAFYRDGDAPSPYARMSYSMVSREKMERGFQIIAKEVKTYVNEHKENGVLDSLPPK